MTRRLTPALYSARHHAASACAAPLHTVWGVLSVAWFCYVCELRGPAWAVGSYSIGQSAGGTSQHIIIKTLRQIGAPRSVCSMAGRPTLHFGGLSSPLFSSSSLLLGSAAAIRLVFLASKRSRRKYCCQSISSRLYSDGLIRHSAPTAATCLTFKALP